MITFINRYRIRAALPVIPQEKPRFASKRKFWRAYHNKTFSRQIFVEELKIASFFITEFTTCVINSITCNRTKGSMCETNYITEVNFTHSFAWNWVERWDNCSTAGDRLAPLHLLQFIVVTMFTLHKLKLSKQKLPNWALIPIWWRRATHIRHSSPTFFISHFLRSAAMSLCAHAERM